MNRGQLLAKPLVLPLIVGLLYALSRLVISRDPATAALAFVVVATAALVVGLLVTRRMLSVRSVEFGEQDVVLHGRAETRVPYSAVTLVERRWFGVPAVLLFRGNERLAAVPSSLEGLSRREIVELIEARRAVSGGTSSSPGPAGRPRSGG